MQLFIDYLPVLVFFVTYVATKSIYMAITALMIAAPIVFAVQWILTKSVNKISAASTGLIIVLGGITLLIGDPLFFYWKPTVLNWAIALVFLGGQFVGKKPVVQRMIEATTKDSTERIVLTPEQWSRLNLMWVAFFAFTGALNIYVAYNFAESTWVNFKLFGLIGLTILFVIIQSVWLARSMQTNESAKEDSEA